MAKNASMQLTGFISASIQSLFRGRGPSNIARLIVPVIVLTVNAVAQGWPRPDSLHELLKRSESKLNSASTIFEVTLISRILTSVFRPVVNFVFLIAGASVLCHRAGGSLGHEAPTGNNNALTQVGAPDDFLSAAFASDMPDAEILGVATNIAQNTKATELLTSQINKSFVSPRGFVDGFVKVKISHYLLRCSRLWSGLGCRSNDDSGRFYFSTVTL